MRTLSRLLILALAVVSATSVFYAIQQQKALRAARQAAESLEKERAELRKQLWDAERRRSGDSTREPASAGANANGGGAVANANADGSVTVDATRVPDGAMRAMNFLDNPDAQRLMALQQRGALDARYAALFRQLNLSPDQLEKFKDLLVEKRAAVADVMAAARSQGLNGRENRDEIRTLMEQTQAEIDGQIRSALGEAAFNQYQNYERTQPQRAVVGQLEQRLSYTSTPLTPQQSEQLVQVFAANSSARPGNATGMTNVVTVAPAGGVMFGPGAGSQLSDDAVAQAATILNPAQQQALQQLQREQQAQSELNQLMRSQFQNRRRAQGTSSGTTPQPATGTPPRG